MGLLGRVVRTIGRIGRSTRGTAVGDGGRFTCASCRTTFDVQHKECPACGSRLVVATDDGGSESDERVPW